MRKDFKFYYFWFIFYTKISRMVIFGLVFLLYCWLLTVLHGYDFVEFLPIQITKRSTILIFPEPDYVGSDTMSDIRTIQT